MTITPAGMFSGSNTLNAPVIPEPDRDITMTESQLNPPTPEEQKLSINAAAFERPLVIGENWFVVSAKWMRRWRKFVHFEGFERDEEAYGKDDYEGSPGPISNNSIIISSDQQSLPKLKKPLMEKLDYELVPEDVWRKFAAWYGGGPEISRKVVEKGKNYTQVELYPLFATVYRTITDSAMESDSTSGSSSNQQVDDAEGSDEEFENVGNKKLISSPEEVAFSNSDNVQKIMDLLKELFNVSVNQDCRLWLAIKGSPYQLVDVSSDIDDVFTGREIGQEFILEIKPLFSDNWPLVRDEFTKSTITGSKSSSSMYTTGPSWIRESTKKSVVSSYGSLYNDYDGDNRPSTPGACGLTNLGNTCFMNSALQCLTKTPQIHKYFTSNDYQKEININNPLGMGGKVAQAFGNLMSEMWSGKHSYIAPREFKNVIGKFAPQFSGYQQQDSQELIAYLLDGLHEDLNRIDKKPITNPVEANGRPDSEVAAEVWSVHRLRNDSIIVDKFQGLLKSTLVCPEESCQQNNCVSITFDPFMYLSLPIPSELTRIIHIVLYRYHNPDTPVKYAVKVSKRGIVKEVREKLVALAADDSLRPENVVLADVFSNKIYKVLPDTSLTSTILENDRIIAYELANMQPDVHEKYEKSTSFGNDTFPPFANVRLQNNNHEVGMPFVVPLDRATTTKKDVYQEVFQFLKRFFDLTALQNRGYDLEKLESLVPHKEGDAVIDSSILFSLHFDDYSDNDVILYEDELVNPKQEQTQTFSYYRRDEQKNYKVSLSSTALECIDEKSIQGAFNEHESLKDTAVEKGISLTSCLNLFTQVEKLGQDNEWYCPRCKKFVQATKKFDIWQLPEVLVIHLKRFQFNRYTRDKIDVFVDYPLDELDMTDHVPQTSLPYQKHLHYELFAVSNHYGGLGGGHYTAFAKIHQNEKWYKFDDSSVSEISESNVKTSSGYVLFYKAKTNNTTSDQPMQTTESNTDTSSSSNSIPNQQ